MLLDPIDTCASMKRQAREVMFSGPRRPALALEGGKFSGGRGSADTLLGRDCGTSLRQTSSECVARSRFR